MIINKDTNADQFNSPEDRNSNVVRPSVTAPSPVVPQPAASVGSAASALAGVSQADLSALIQLLVMREARASQKDEAEETRRAARAKQYAENRTDDEKVSLIRQTNCKHLKGGKTRRRNAAEDFNVSLHAFITGEAYVKCESCRMKWRPTDTIDFVVRGGKVYKNHTKKGWTEALDMVGRSTNTPSSSEIPGENLGKLPKEIKKSAAATDVDMEPVGDAEPVNV